ncbi:7 alpha-ribazole-5'-phosphate phosphatase [Sterolibacterium denitrificans]|uniref:7 alpha-ribazole-5'-phosphate phosphatase n=1 Tax=Sterolibacterium denitrificans TaxID=157592 RepID=A0A7Z7HP36_9PROT|nr:histidine phosphatase family protein [Sterolibacterium denitrificans]SMB21066.1 7 alpha-ribazole-5'-phosphate phosphatase [Sterolibacterium denitrificans]
MNIGLLRHGATCETSDGVLRGRGDDALSPEGWRQLRRAATTTAQPHRWRRIVSSPLRRCADFAHELAAQWALPLSIDARLSELDFGAWEGRHFNDLLAEPDSAAALQGFWEDPWRHPPPQGETLLAFEARVLAAWNELSAVCAAEAEAETSATLVITHGGVIRLLLCAMRGLPRTELLKLDVAHASLHLLPSQALRPLSRPGDVSMPAST